MAPYCFYLRVRSISSQQSLLYLLYSQRAFVAHTTVHVYQLQSMKIFTKIFKFAICTETNKSKSTTSKAFWMNIKILQNCARMSWTWAVICDLSWSYCRLTMQRTMCVARNTSDPYSTCTLAKNIACDKILRENFYPTKASFHTHVL